MKKVKEKLFSIGDVVYLKEHHLYWVCHSIESVDTVINDIHYVIAFKGFVGGLSNLSVEKAREDATFFIERPIIDGDDRWSGVFFGTRDDVADRLTIYYSDDGEYNEEYQPLKPLTDSEMLLMWNSIKQEEYHNDFLYLETPKKYLGMVFINNDTKTLFIPLIYNNDEEESFRGYLVAPNSTTTTATKTVDKLIEDGFEMIGCIGFKYSKLRYYIEHNVCPIVKRLVYPCEKSVYFLYVGLSPTPVCYMKTCAPKFI